MSTAGNGDDEELAVGTTVDFSMSTTTSTGLGISAGLSLSTDYDSNNGSVAAMVELQPSQLVEQQS